MSINKIEQIFTERAEMLAAVTPYISTRLKEQLRRKIAREREKLANLITFSEAEQTSAQNTPYTLNRAFFERRSLDTTLFE